MKSSPSRGKTATWGPRCQLHRMRRYGQTAYVFTGRSRPSSGQREPQSISVILFIGRTRPRRNLSSGSKCQVRKLHASTSSLNHDVDVGRRRRLDELLQEASGFFGAGKLFLPQHQVEVAGRGRYRQMGGELEGDAADGSPGAAAMAEDSIYARER